MIGALLISLAASSIGLKPNFEFPYQNVTMESGMMQYLQCKAQGEKPMTYKWYNQKEDEITTDYRYPVWVKKWAGLTFLVFNTLSSKYEGSYTCTASNMHGLSSKVYSVRAVLAPSGLKPEFDFPFQNITLETGMERSLWCGAQGQKPITYKWYNQKGDEIRTVDYRSPVYIKSWAGDSYLVFTRLQEGSYTCTATNTHGTASKVYFLRSPPPNGMEPKFDANSQNLTMESGFKQDLQCKANGEKPFTYKWYNQKEEEITTDYRYPVWAKYWAGQSFLVFNSLSNSQEGLYTCAASNKHGMASKRYFVRVVPPPSGLKPAFDYPSQNVTLESGMEQFLWCGAQGQETKTYKWYNQEGHEITTTDYRYPVYIMSWQGDSLLYFAKQQEVSYTCTASNVHGMATKVFYLRFPPTSDHAK